MRHTEVKNAKTGCTNEDAAFRAPSSPMHATPPATGTAPAKRLILSTAVHTQHAPVRWLAGASGRAKQATKRRLRWLANTSRHREKKPRSSVWSGVANGSYQAAATTNPMCSWHNGEEEAHRETTNLKNNYLYIRRKYTWVTNIQG